MVVRELILGFFVKNLGHGDVLRSGIAFGGQYLFNPNS